ncbi:43086_t:CDS:2, partial [Gigaspora margarita]
IELACLSTITFNYLKTIRTSYTEQKQNPKQKYDYGISHAKKALNYTICADTVNKLVDYLEKFIEKTKIELDKQQNHVENVKNMDIGRQPKRYKSGVQSKRLPTKKAKGIRDITNEAIILNNDNNLKSNSNSSNSNSLSKRVRHCQKCKQAGHYAP